MNTTNVTNDWELKSQLVHAVTLLTDLEGESFEWNPEGRMDLSVFFADDNIGQSGGVVFTQEGYLTATYDFPKLNYRSIHDMDIWRFLQEQGFKQSEWTWVAKDSDSFYHRAMGTLTITSTRSFL